MCRHHVYQELNFHNNPAPNERLLLTSPSPNTGITTNLNSVFFASCRRLTCPVLRTLPACTSGASTCPSVRKLIWLFRHHPFSQHFVLPLTPIQVWENGTPSSPHQLQWLLLKNVGRLLTHIPQPHSGTPKGALLHGTPRSFGTHIMPNTFHNLKLYNISSLLWTTSISLGLPCTPTPAYTQANSGQVPKDFRQIPHRIQRSR